MGKPTVIILFILLGSLIFGPSYIESLSQDKTPKTKIEFSEVWEIDKLTLAENKDFIIHNSNKEIFIFQYNIQEIFNMDSEIKSVEVLSNSTKELITGDAGISTNPKIIISDNAENMFYNVGDLFRPIIKIKIIK